MANILATLGLEIDSTGAVRGLRDVDHAADRTSRNVSELTRLARNLGLAFGAYEVLQWAKDTIALADAYTTMQSRLALVTHSAENLAMIQRELFGLAQESRTPLESVSLLYERLARVSGELGLSQEEVLRHTETINKAMVISGTSAEGTRAALIQLSQGFAAGTLRGDELNAVLEQAPRLAQAIADGMGVSVGMLRRMGAEGKLTADAIVDALEDQAAAIDREFAGMEMTVGGAMTRLRNAWMNYVGGANEASGATSGLAEAINSIADAVDPVGEKVNAFFGGIALMAVDAAVAWEGFKARMASGLPDWMLSAEGRASKANATATLDALEIWRQEEYDRILGTNRPDSRAYGAGAGGGGGKTPDPAAVREAARQAEAYRDMRQELQYAREDLEAETRALQDSFLAREYNRNALEHERRVREIMAEQAPEYQAELIRESEAVMAAANAHAQRTHHLEREEDLFRALADADRAATAELVAREAERRRALEVPFENAIENIQRGWGEMFTRILADGETTAADLAQIFQRAAGEMVAGMLIARAQRRLAGIFGESDEPPTLGQQMNRDAIGGALAGGVLGYGLGRATGGGMSGFLAGGASGAAAGAMVGGPIGAAVGGLTGAITGLIGGLSGAAEAARRAREAQEQYRLSLEALEASVRGDRIAEAIARIRAEMEALRDQAIAAGLGGGEIWTRNGANHSAELTRINALEAERIALLQEEYETMLRQTGEDLQVRALVAQGRDDEAARLRLQLDHQRELDDLIKQIDADGTRTAAEEALLAQMLYTQELERTAQAMAGVNQQAANLPATFKMAGYVFEAMQELSADQYRRAVFAGTGAAAPSAPPAPSAGAVPPAGGSAGSGEPFAIGPMTLMLNENVLAKGMLKVYKRGASGPGKEKTAAILSDITVS